MRRSLGFTLVLVAVWVVLAVPAIAQDDAASSSSSAEASGTSGIGWNGWGVRVGLSADPDQVYAGFHFELGEFARDVRFRPTIEVGFGDDATLLQALAEVHYVFSKVQVWKPYVGGGVGWSWVKLDNVPAGRKDSDSDLALMGIGGVETKMKSGTLLFFELKIGFGDDDPDLKLGVGWGW
jgi:opacity protein-like surface antigen